MKWIGVMALAAITATASSCGSRQEDERERLEEATCGGVEYAVRGFDSYDDCVRHLRHAEE